MKNKKRHISPPRSSLGPFISFSYIYLDIATLKEKERRHQKEQEVQCLLPHLCWLCVIIPRLPPQNLGAGGPFLTLPIVLGKVVTSYGHQIRRTGSDRM